jgi:hypothetical protein
MSTHIDYLRKVSAKLLVNTPDDYWSYWDQPIPNELDYEIIKLIDYFIELDLTQRNVFFERLSDKHSQILFAFSERMASLGVRERSTEPLLYGLLALIIEAFKFDWRENISRFSLFYDAAIKIDHLPEKLFLKAASYARDDIANDVEAFLKRDDKLKSIGVMGYEEGLGVDGFRYTKLNKFRFTG